MHRMPWRCRWGLRVSEHACVTRLPRNRALFSWGGPHRTLRPCTTGASNVFCWGAREETGRGGRFGCEDTDDVSGVVGRDLRVTEHACVTRLPRKRTLRSWGGPHRTLRPCTTGASNVFCQGQEGGGGGGGTFQICLPCIKSLIESLRMTFNDFGCSAGEDKFGLNYITHS